MADGSTLMGPGAEIDSLIVSTTTLMGVSTDLIRAIVTVESSWNTWANRFEPAVYASQRYLIQPVDFASTLMISVETEKVNQSMSWGLGQVMGFLARELGYRYELPKLMQPDIGLKYCVMNVKRLMQRYNDESDVIAAYNAGSARKLPSGFYFNQGYVDKVSGRLNSLRKFE